MGNIVLLDDLTINKIAAGEVIERPASVVKELVENAIDAGATNINVEIRNGGISYIRITDNGKGIMLDDMEIAFERHATSKIRTAEDLETVKSMGFRGEALASIAAISRIEMRSKTRDGQTGYKIVLEGGNVLEKNEDGCPFGTTITVENLFFNTPVRYKFLKKDFTEAGYIEDVVTRIALVNPNIAIKLINTGKTIIQTSGNGNIRDVIYNIYGKEIAENVVDVNYSYDDIVVTGVIGKPSISRSNRANQLFFVNKRYIKDKTLTSAAEQGYKGMITIGKFGFLVLNLDINPQKVDCNVHPAKLEVRFEEESKVFKAVYHAIKDNLLKSDLVNDTEKEYSNENTNYFSESTINNEPKNTGLFQKILNKNKKDDYKDFGSNNVIEQIYNNRNEDTNTANENKNVEYNTKFNEIVNKMNEMRKDIEVAKNNDNEDVKNNPQTNNEELQNTAKFNIDENDLNNTKIYKTQSNLEETKVMDLSEISNQNNGNILEDILKEKSINTEKQITDSQIENKFEDMYSSIFGTTPKQDDKIQEDDETYKVEMAPITSETNISVFEGKEEFQKPTYKFIGIAFSTYIIIELDKELYIIDQHAAHERIMYEKVKENYYSDSIKDSQLMLLPDIITLTHKEMDVAKENMEMFEKAGFVLEEFGENTIKLTGVPNICIDLDTKELFLETLDEINTVARTAKQEIEEKFIATVACKAAVKANMALSKDEVNNLMDKLLTLPNPFTCPHGRPTAIKMTKTDIEKKFSRR